MRKNLTVSRHDLLMKWKYENAEGVDVYDVFVAGNYTAAVQPVATIELKPGVTMTHVQWAQGITDRPGALSATGPE